MKYPHIETGKHQPPGLGGPRFRINTAPGVMEPKYRVNEAHGSYLEHHLVVELRDELNAWLEANPTVEEVHAAELCKARSDALREAAEDIDVSTYYRTPYKAEQHEIAAVYRAALLDRADQIEEDQ